MSKEYRLTPGSTILVTGVNGLIASHVADQALNAGYRVLGTVRDIGKSKWIQDRFDNQYGKDKFELATVKDLSAEAAFDDVVKGVSGIAHVASILGSTDPNDMIPPVVAGAVNLLRAAAREPSVKAVVYTSSSWACATPVPNIHYHIDEALWNEDAVKTAWAPPPYTQERFMAVYAASKVEAEKACWNFMREEKPSFVFNAVLPAANFGKVLDPVNQGYPSTTAWLKDLFLGEINMQPFIPPQYFIDTEDTALLHLAALIDPAIVGKRIFGYAEPYSWNQILRAFRKLYPDRKFVDDFADHGADLSTKANERSVEMLKFMGRDGFTSLEQSIQNTANSV